MGRVVKTLMVCAAIGFAAQAANAELVVSVEGPGGENKLGHDIFAPSYNGTVDLFINFDGPASDTYDNFFIEMDITPGLTLLAYEFVAPNAGISGNSMAFVRGSNDFTGVSDTFIEWEAAVAVNGVGDFAAPPGRLVQMTFDTSGTTLGDSFTFDLFVDTVAHFLNNQLVFRDANAGQTFTLNIVPEPMTLALLGVGGLVALRRRRTA